MKKNVADPKRQQRHQAQNTANPKMSTSCFFKRNLFVSHKALLPAPFNNPIKKNKVEESDGEHAKLFGRKNARQPDGQGNITQHPAILPQAEGYKIFYYFFFGYFIHDASIMFW